MSLEKRSFTNDFINPFANFGDIVSGDRFIGRQEWLRLVARRVLQGGNLELVGIPRIGKSSLIYQEIMEHKRKLLEERYLPLWINLDTYDDSQSFFRSLITECVDELKTSGYLTETMEYTANEVLQEAATWTDWVQGLKDFFRKVRSANIRTIFILDEFDAARYIFKGKASAFQTLRQLASQPDWKVTLVTTSRRPIRDIEEQARGASTLYGVFQRRDLSMFGEADMEAYFAHLAALGIPFTSLLKERIDFYCGRHPYILEMLGYEIVETFYAQQGDGVDVDALAHSIERPLVDYYDQLTNLLREDGKLDKLLQILFGPVIDVKPTDVDELLQYGLIKSNQENYVAFSKHFHEFLHLIEREIELWPLLSRTERMLRTLIVEVLEKEYPENWFEKLEKAHPKLGDTNASGKNLFQRCKEAQQRAVRTWGTRAPQNLLDYTYPKELIDIVSSEWRLFELIFGKDKKYWADRAALLGKVRNPLAHNWENAMSEHERNYAEGVCKEILSIINTYIKKSENGPLHISSI